MACTSRRVLLRSNPTCNMRTGPPSVTPAGSHRKRDPGGGPRLHGIQGQEAAPPPSRGLRSSWHSAPMSQGSQSSPTEEPAAAEQECVFCGVTRHGAEASIVVRTPTVTAFMDRYPVAEGHALVV